MKRKKENLMNSRSVGAEQDIHVRGEGDNTGLTLKPLRATTEDNDPLVGIALVGNYQRAVGIIQLSRLKKAIAELEAIYEQRMREAT